MPSRVFTRAQVLAALADDVARREAESIPDFIYLFLRDVFFAVDDDSDGYVTAAAVSHVFDALAPAHAPPTPASCSSATSCVSSAAAQASTAAQSSRCGGGGGGATTVMPPLMAPAVHPSWRSATSYVASTAGPLATAAHRPLELCAFMQSYWPMVSDRMAHFVGDDTWSQQSRRSSDDPGCPEHGGPSVPARLPRRILFSPSSFRDVTDTTAVDGAAGFGARDGGCEAAVLGCDAIDAEQQRLYHDAVRHLWPCGSGAAAESGSPQAPQRLLSDGELRELHAAFCFLDTNHSGYVSVAELTTALDALLRTAACADRCDGGDRGADRVASTGSTTAAVGAGVAELAASMMRVAASATSSFQAAPPARAQPPPAALPATEPCLSWTAFVRTFQCDVGAFPAELIAWCAGCARAGQLPSTYATSPHALATSSPWMSPVECAVLQEVLVSYSELLRHDTTPLSAASTSAAHPALSERSSVNTHTTRKPSCPRISGDGVEGAPVPLQQAPPSCTAWLTHATAMTLRRWCHDRPTRSATATEAGHSTAVPVSLLAACLRRDLEELLFPSAPAFSAAAAAALRGVAEHHAQAVCAVARRAALAPQPATHHSAHGDALVNVERLVNIIADDPRYLRLDVLVPLEARLAAVVDAAQRLPRRRVEEAVALLAAFVRRAQRDGAAGLTEVLALRCELSALSPLLARLVTGAAGIAGGRLHLEDCLAVLSYQVLAAPPAMPRGGAAAMCEHPCYALIHDARVEKAAHGWLRYACRRLATCEVRSIVAGLQAQASVDAALHDAAPCPLHERFASLWPAVRTSCAVSRIDAVVAAHVTLVVVVATSLPQSNRVPTCGSATAATSRWAELEGLLAQWVSEQHNAACTADSADAWAMHAITCVSGEVGPLCGRAVSVALCSMSLTQPATSRAAVAVVEEAALTETLTRVVATHSLWTHPSASTSASITAAAAHSRLVHTVVGACPRRGSPTLLDVTALLRRWLEAHPLPLPVTHLSVCCAVAEVESTYYTLKRLAASEEGQRGRSATPAGWASVAAASRAASCAAAPAVTGISAVCLSELLENANVLLALYAVSAPAHVGVWGGALSRLSTALRPVLLSPTGVRVSLEKSGAQSTRPSSPVVAPALPLSPACGEAGLDGACGDTSTSALEVALVSMAVPAALQHAVAQLHHRVDADGVGAVTEDQLRSHRPRVPASARYGWHRFVTALCSRSLPASSSASSAPPPPPQPTKAASSAASVATAVNTSAAHASVAFVTGGFSPSVLRSHRWRRRPRPPPGQPSVDGSVVRGWLGAVLRPSGTTAEEASRSSVATLRSEDEIAAVFTQGDLLARVAELRACVQAQLLGEAQQEADRGKVAGLVMARRPPGALTSGTTARRGGPAPPSLAALVRDAGTASPSPAAGTARWWAAYLEEFCRSFSPLAS